ncbi:MAG: hypothetical protein JO281_23595 [Pseudonocardiales bacterium]|nr:hypothetical protein [Pseudonocardiales bacterium]
MAETPYRFRIDQHGDMRVPGIVLASTSLSPDARADRSLEQGANIATLPGIMEASADRGGRLRLGPRRDPW